MRPDPPTTPIAFSLAFPLFRLAPSLFLSNSFFFATSCGLAGNSDLKRAWGNALTWSYLL